MVNHILFLILALIVILGLDQSSKFYIEQNLPLYTSIEVVPNLLNITHIRNTGIAFGLFAGKKRVGATLLFLTVSGIAIGIIGYLYYTSHKKNHLRRAAFALILGGAVGNMIDRVRLQEVIDFIDVHWYHYHWPAFNIADSCVTIGMGLFILDSLIKGDK